MKWKVEFLWKNQNKTKRKRKEKEKNESDANRMLNVESQNGKKKVKLLTEFFKRRDEELANNSVEEKWFFPLSLQQNKNQMLGWLQLNFLSNKESNPR